MHILKTSSSSRECFENSESGGHCNVRAIRYKRILFFYELPRRVSFRSLRLRLRQCLLWCRVHVCCRAAVWRRICGAAHPCCRALVMLPRTRILPLIRGAAHSHTAALCSAAHLYAARAAKWSQVLCVPRPMLPRSSTCCRVPWCRAGGQMVSVLCVAASHGAARAAKWSQFSVLPRPMVPRSSTCCRVPWCRACGQMVSVLCVAASHGAAQFYMLP